MKSQGQDRQAPGQPGKGSVIPVHLLVLDVLGVLLVALGVGEHFNSLALVPPALQFENYAITLIIAGALLMLPMLLHLVELIRTRAAAAPRERR